MSNNEKIKGAFTAFLVKNLARIVIAAVLIGIGYLIGK